MRQTGENVATVVSEPRSMRMSGSHRRVPRGDLEVSDTSRGPRVVKQARVVLRASFLTFFWFTRKLTSSRSTARVHWLSGDGAIPRPSEVIPVLCVHARARVWTRRPRTTRPGPGVSRMHVQTSNNKREDPHTRARCGRSGAPPGGRSTTCRVTLNPTLSKPPSHGVRVNGTPGVVRNRVDGPRSRPHRGLGFQPRNKREAAPTLKPLSNQVERAGPLRLPTVNENTRPVKMNPALPKVSVNPARMKPRASICSLSRDTVCRLCTVMILVALFRIRVSL